MLRAPLFPAVLLGLLSANSFAENAVYIEQAVRESPQGTAKELTRLPRGTGVPYLGAREGWLRVQTSAGDVGWAKIVSGAADATSPLSSTEGIGDLVQLRGTLRLRSRAHQRGKATADVGTGECLMVRGLSKNGQWILVETGDLRTGWVPGSSARKVLGGRSTSSRVGVACEVSPRQRTALRSRPSSRGRRAEDVKTSDVLWVEETSRKGRWVLVEGYSGQRGWLRTRSTNLRKESQMRRLGKRRNRWDVFEASMSVETRSKNTALFSHPTSQRRGRLVAAGTPLYIMDIVDAKGAVWLLTEDEDGRWGWLPAKEVKPTALGVAIVEGDPVAAVSATAPTVVAPAPPGISFSGDISGDYSLPSIGIASPQTSTPSFSVAIRAKMTKPLGSFRFTGFARFIFAHRTAEDAPSTRAQSYDARAIIAYPARLTPYLGAGYILSTNNTPLREGTYALVATSGPLAVAGLNVPLFGPLYYNLELQGRYPFSIDREGVASYNPLFDIENQVGLGFSHFGIYARLNSTRSGGTLGHQYTAGLSVSY